MVEPVLTPPSLYLSARVDGERSQLGFVAHVHVAPGRVVAAASELFEMGASAAGLDDKALVGIVHFASSSQITRATFTRARVERIVGDESSLLLISAIYGPVELSVHVQRPAGPAVAEPPVLELRLTVRPYTTDDVDRVRGLAEQVCSAGELVAGGFGCDVIFDSQRQTVWPRCRGSSVWRPSDSLRFVPGYYPWTLIGERLHQPIIETIEPASEFRDVSGAVVRLYEAPTDDGTASGIHQLRTMLRPILPGFVVAGGTAAEVLLAEGLPVPDSVGPVFHDYICGQEISAYRDHLFNATNTIDGLSEAMKHRSSELQLTFVPIEGFGAVAEMALRSALDAINRGLSEGWFPDLGGLIDYQLEQRHDATVDVNIAIEDGSADLLSLLAATLSATDALRLSSLQGPLRVFGPLKISAI